MFHPTRSLLFLTFATLGCSGAGVPGPHGERVYLRILDETRVSLNGEPMTWDELSRRMRAHVVEAEAGRASPPWVVIETDPEVAQKLGDRGARLGSRLVDLLFDLGVRSVDLGQ